MGFSDAKAGTNWMGKRIDAQLEAKNLDTWNYLSSHPHHAGHGGSWRGIKPKPAYEHSHGGIEQGNWKETQEGINAVSQIMKDYNKQVVKAVEVLASLHFDGGCW